MKMGNIAFSFGEYARPVLQKATAADQEILTLLLSLNRYIARHKEVSRLMDLIDLAQKRSSKSFVAAEEVYSDEVWAKDTIVIDPEEGE